MKNIQNFARKSSFLIFLLMFLVSVFFGAQKTLSFFRALAVSEKNLFQTGWWEMPQIKIFSPEEGAVLYPEDEYAITWKATSADSQASADMKIAISYSCQGNKWIEITDKTDNDGKYVWLVPDLEAADCQIVIIATDTHDLSAEAYSGIFSISRAVKPGQVVINEIMWMGSAEDPEDEWIELRNTTQHEIDISGWNLQQGGKGKGSGEHIEIPSGYTLPAGGYFLITKKKWSETAINLKRDLKKNEGYTHVSGMDLDDEGEPLILTTKNKNGLVMDRANGEGAWFEGKSQNPMQSMERKDPPKDGTEEENWETCTDPRCQSGDYWKIPEGSNFGTPGKKNLD